MSTESDKVRSIAERIASRLADGAVQQQGESRERAAAEAGDELAQLRAALRELQQRLAHVESHVAHGGECAEHARDGGESAGARQASRQGGARQESRAPQQQFLSSTYVSAAHPSQERFQIGEAVSELVDFFESEKTCNVEPGGKPCDHCSMCSSRGF